MPVHRARDHEADLSREGPLAPLIGDPATVERPAPGRAPSAFRIWRAGANPTDMGIHRFTSASAEAIMASQAQRGNLYPIDIDHLSLSETAPLQAKKAVGWFQLDTRLDAGGNPELWATNVEWSMEVRRGLESTPPEWRYFSPVYNANDAGEITAFYNLSITNNPATHGVTALASTHNDFRRLMAKMPDLQPSERLFMARMPLGVVRATSQRARPRPVVQRLQRLERMAIAMGAPTRLGVVHEGTRMLLGVRVLADPEVLRRAVAPQQVSAAKPPKEKSTMKTNASRPASHGVPSATLLTAEERREHMRRRMGAPEDRPLKLGCRMVGTALQIGVLVPA